jgi:hypothetical protein
MKLTRPSREYISKLEDRVVGNGIEIVIAIDLTGQTPLDYVEERVERREGSRRPSFGLKSALQFNALLE